MDKAIKILIAILRTLQVIIIFILSLILFVVQINESDFKYRWSFESCNFSNISPIGEDTILKTLKKIWRLKNG
jgi:hypothetical protein